MPDVPYPVRGQTVEELVAQMQRLIQELYEERLAGHLIGDVFETGNDDVFTLRLSANGGLQKSEGQLEIKASPTGGLQINANGIGIKLDTNSLLELSATGTKVTNTKIWPVGSFFFGSDATNPATLLGYGTWALVGTGNLTLT